MKPRPLGAERPMGLFRVADLSNGSTDRGGGIV
jgi:hypothetical protein